MFPVPDIFSIVPVFIFIIAVAVLAVIAFRLLRALAEWSYNNQQPVQSLAATVRTKRADVRGYSSEQGGRTRTNYFVTFEFSDGTRREVRVPAEAYGQMAEGDAGTLTIQGSRFRDFSRTGARVMFNSLR